MSTCRKEGGEEAREDERAARVPDDHRSASPDDAVMGVGAQQR